MSKYTAYTGMGILVLITIVVVTMAAFSMGCTENGGNDTGLTGDGDDTIMDEDDTEYIIGDAVVDDIEIFIMESFPLQVSVNATGYLPDGCTFIDEDNIEVTRDGNTFNVALKTKRPADLMCTQALEPFEVNIPLDVYGLEAGVYTVNVNGVTDTFEFTMDNVIE